MPRENGGKDHWDKKAKEWQARTRELEYRKLLGELVERREVEAQFVSRILAVKQGLLALARGLTVTGAAKTDVEDFTTPTQKPAAVAKPTETATAQVPPQRLRFDKPQAYAPAPDVSRQPPPDKGKEGRDGKGKGGQKDDIPLGDRPPTTAEPRPRPAVTDCANARG